VFGQYELPFFLVTLVVLQHTFIHLPGVGTHRERALWQQGILDWNRFLEAAENLPEKERF